MDVLKIVAARLPVNPAGRQSQVPFLLASKRGGSCCWRRSCTMIEGFSKSMEIFPLLWEDNSAGLNSRGMNFDLRKTIGRLLTARKGIVFQPFLREWAASFKGCNPMNSPPFEPSQANPVRSMNFHYLYVCFRRFWKSMILWPNCP